MYQYIWDKETGGPLLITELSKFSKEPRPVYYKELDILGFDKYWNYPKDDSAPLMWAEANNYIYKGRTVARTKGGALYTAPEIIILEEPEPDGQPLEFVDIDAMIAKNSLIMESLIQETIQKVYNTYRSYKKKVDLFYVAFSGGKDSAVTLDIVQRALPHNDFIVLFGDTRMEFTDTYDAVDKFQMWCEKQGISFLRSQSKYTPAETWNLIGPPAQKMRWCCSVHKTAPQILLLRKLTNNPQFRGMAMMGVRADESVTRSRYDELNFGTKHQGQYDFYPILNWNSAELFIYIYKEHLILNDTYKKGNSRAGCLVCPMESVKNTWFKEQSYAGSPCDCHTTTFFNDIIIKNTFAKDLPPEKLKEFMEIGVWKSRHNGSKLSVPREIYHEEKNGSDLSITLDEISTDWKEWLKTVGQLNFLPDNTVEIFCENERYMLKYTYSEKKHIFLLQNIGNRQKDIYFISWIKTILKKSAYCILCQVCEANCPNGYIHMDNGQLHIDDKCVKCKKCYNVNGGCIVSASQRLPKEGNRMNGSIDQYKNMGIRYSWVVEYLNKKDEFWNDNGLGSMMLKSLKTFLRHAEITDKNKITNFGRIVASLGGESAVSWALMICNLVYTPQFNWWVMNIDTNRQYTHKELDEMLKELLTDNSRKNVISGFKNIFCTNPVLGENLGFGFVNVEKKGKNTYLIDAYRTSWTAPDPRVILYSLYKFAEKCGDYYQFTLTELLDNSIERDGISPTRIFGLDYDTMIPILNGLSANYPDFISASFALGLDTINLSSDKKPQDVLTLFDVDKEVKG